MTASAKIEYDPRPTTIQRWTAVTTGPSGLTRRKRHLSRKSAINTAASFLTVWDERAIQARLEYERVHREIVTEYEHTLEKEAPPDDN